MLFQCTVLTTKIASLHIQIIKIILKDMKSLSFLAVNDSMVACYQIGFSLCENVLKAYGAHGMFALLTNIKAERTKHSWQES